MQPAILGVRRLCGLRQRHRPENNASAPGPGCERNSEIHSSVVARARMSSSTSVSVQGLPDLCRRAPAAEGRAQGRFLVVSDRLPIVLTRDGGEGWRAAPARGALISALTPVLKDRRGVWIGWPGVVEEKAPGL